MTKKSKRIPSQKPESAGSSVKQATPAGGPFHPGAIVLVTLNNPREKLWGAILGLNPAGVSLHGIELSSFDEAINMVVSREPLNAGALFFPMHRVERIQLDLPEGTIPSLSERFTHRTGLTPSEALAQAMAAAGGAGA